MDGCYLPMWIQVRVNGFTILEDSGVTHQVMSRIADGVRSVWNTEVRPRGWQKMKVAVTCRFQEIPWLRRSLVLRFVAAAGLAVGAITLSACGKGAVSVAGSPSIVGTWDCGGNKYTFTASGWSSEGTPSRDLPYKIDGGYIYMHTLANQTLPMLKAKDGIVYDNADGIPGTGAWDSPCKKAS